MKLPEILENQKFITVLELGLGALLLFIAVQSYQIGQEIEMIQTMIENGKCAQLSGELVWK